MINFFKSFILLGSIFCFLFSCNKPKEKLTPNNSTDYLWEDQTDIYLPKTAEWTNRVEAADLNQDGKVDLIFANGGDYSKPGTLESSRVFINQGANTPFLEITKQVFGEDKFYARVIKASDLNQDGFTDLLVGNTFQTQSELYLGQQNGSFLRVTDTHLPNLEASVGDLEFGDVDGDGDLDVILSDWGPGSNMNNEGGKTLLWLNDGFGKFEDVTDSQMPDILIQFSWDLEFFDFDNDFDLDIAISCKRCGTSRIFENNGKGHFNDKRILPAYTNNYEFEIADINQDGFLDLVTVNDGEIVDGKSWSRREHIFLNDSAKRFLDATSRLWLDQDNPGEDDNNVAFLDYDSDGDPDFILSSLTGEDRLLINDGTGKFKLQESILSGDPTPHTLSLVFADLNNDHRMDIIMGQGEGEESIEERIYIGKKIQADVAPPIISHVAQTTSAVGTRKVFARITDNKSPSMPQDWREVVVISDTNKVSMTWYGEYLWVADLSELESDKPIEICATDAAGNQACRKVN
ncbi:FG-GAP repeat domain-containing protein [Algoriphagus halophilus]|uniref:Repeat domain-containing protein n=1 Tax=Algoriphagus halophilus TaxID=226505 RepID=A0A1N6FKG9_9BACT|nr:VCBS repeat-containing protein [Algoriphagus halophilus]SIN95758.1 Repeat domain-containing protein [Algoriphagus halophilus]